MGESLWESDLSFNFERDKHRLGGFIILNLAGCWDMVIVTEVLGAVGEHSDSKHSG